MLRAIYVRWINKFFSQYCFKSVSNNISASFLLLLSTVRVYICLNIIHYTSYIRHVVNVNLQKWGLS